MDDRAKIQSRNGCLPSWCSSHDIQNLKSSSVGRATWNSALREGQWPHHTLTSFCHEGRAVVHFLIRYLIYFFFKFQNLSFLRFYLFLIFLNVQCDDLIYVYIVKWLPQSSSLTYPSTHIIPFFVCVVRIHKVYFQQL